MSRRIKINFAKFWGGFDPRENFFTEVLAELYDVEVSASPDYLFYSVFAGEMPPGSYTRIFYSAENVRPDMGSCDWALTYDAHHPDKRHFRLPYYSLLGAGTNLIKGREAAAEKKKKFCNFVFFKDVGKRNRFCRRLARYRKVDCPGRSLTNVDPIGRGHTPQQSRSSPAWGEEKIDFLRDYKFTIAFENDTFPGYTSEKIYHAMVAGSIPIYWGNPLIDEEFNPRSFVNVHQYETEVRAAIPRWVAALPGVERFWIEPRTFDRVVDRVREIDEDESMYRAVLAEPWLHENRISKELDRNRLKNFFRGIFAKGNPKSESSSDRPRDFELPQN